MNIRRAISVSADNLIKSIVLITHDVQLVIIKLTLVVM